MLRWLAGLVIMFAAVPPGHGQPGAVGAMGATPMAVDLKKAPLGSWADYVTTVGQVTVKTRWAFVARDQDSHTLETIIDGGPMGKARQMTMRLVLAAVPTGAGSSLKQMVMQVGDQDPMEMPIDRSKAQQFQKPDPKNLVGKERITVAGGSILASHYRDSSGGGSSEVWLSEDAPPVGMVKVRMIPAPGAKDPAGRPMPPVTVELVARGLDAKPTITKPVRSFKSAKPGMSGGMSVPQRTAPRR
jgi:hypothetical protein